MSDLIFTPLSDSMYYGIITILNYEIRLSRCLAKLSFPSLENDNERRIIVDMALKSGIDQYRFIEFPIDKQGKILTDNHSYAKPDRYLEKRANYILQENKDIVLNSILPDCKKNELFATHY